jgi:hypothetical protein
MKTALSITTGLVLLSSFPSSTVGALVFAKTIQGEGLCARCELKESKQCQTAIRVREDKRRVVYYAEDNRVARDFQAKACESVKPVTATGTVRERGGKLLITLKEIEMIKP